MFRDWVFYSILFVPLGCMIALAGVVIYQDVKDVYSDYSGFALDEYSNQTIKGVYVYGDSIIIPTSNRNMDSINKTIAHEYVHYLIKQDYEHFCKNEYER